MEGIQPLPKSVVDFDSACGDLGSILTLNHRILAATSRLPEYREYILVGQSRLSREPVSPRPMLFLASLRTISPADRQTS
jgi:hypothetical protein